MKSKDIRHFPFRVEETVGETDNIDINQLVEAEAILIGALLFLFIFLAPFLLYFFIFNMHTVKLCVIHKENESNWKI